MKFNFHSILFQSLLTFIVIAFLLSLWLLYCVEDRKNEMIQEVLEKEIYLIEKIIDLPDFKEKEMLLESLDDAKAIIYVKFEERKIKETKIENGVYNSAPIKIISLPFSESKILKAGISLERAYQKHRELLKEYLIFSFSLLIAVLAIVFFFLKEIILPIKKLKNSCEEIKKGNLEIKIEELPKNEIGDLITTFEKMIEEIKNSREELEESKAILEIKVKARSKELEELNKSLEDKVQERTLELQGREKQLQEKGRQLRERIDELERLHNLTVGRELKMIELKKRVKELEEFFSQKENKNS